LNDRLEDEMRTRTDTRQSNWKATTKTTFLALAFLIGATGCAALRAASAKNAHLQKATQTHIYQKPCTEVWTAARTMLFSRDYQVKSADATAGLTLETDWKDDGKGTSRRYLFQGTAPAESSCTVAATMAVKDMKGNTSTYRDWAIEWDLLQQVDSATAAQIEGDADKAGEVARNAQ
jgi:hypothetical protein